MVRRLRARAHGSADQAAVPITRPMPAVAAIANAPRNVTRTVPRHTLALPVRAPGPLDGARPNAAVLDAAATLAKHSDARIIGITACEPVRLGGADGYINGEFAVLERDIVTEELARAETELHAHAGLRSHVLEWRSIPTLENVAHIIATQARCADLPITGVGPVPGDRSTHADTRDLILRAGRPVLVVPDANVTANFRNVVVAWTHTREFRRAVMDALPMLHDAGHATLVEASKDPAGARDGIEDLAGWLDRHGFGASAHISARSRSGSMASGVRRPASGVRRPASEMVSNTGLARSMARFLVIMCKTTI